MTPTFEKHLQSVRDFQVKGFNFHYFHLKISLSVKFSPFLCFWKHQLKKGVRFHLKFQVKIKVKFSGSFCPKKLSKIIADHQWDVCALL